MTPWGAVPLRRAALAAAVFLAAATLPAGVEEDLASLAASDFEAREAAFRSLLEAGIRDPASVLPLLPSSPQDPDVRAACDMLRKEIPIRRARRVAEELAGRDGALRRKVSILFDPLDGAKTRGLADLLGRQPASSEIFILLLSHEDLEVRSQCVLALSGHEGDGPRRAILASLSDPEPRVRAIAAIVLGKRKDAPEGPASLARLLDDPSAEVRTAAAGSLGALRSAEHAPRLLELMEESDLESQRTAMLAVAEIAPPGAAKRILPFLSDANEGLRLCALQSLVRLRDREALPSILARLDAAEEGERVQILGALAQIGDATVFDAVLARMDDPSAQVRSQAMQSAGILRIAKALPRIRDRLRGRSPVERFAAVEALAAFKDPRLVSLLMPLVDDAQLAHPALHRAGEMAGVTFILKPNAVKAAKEWWSAHRDDPRYQLPPELRE